MDRRRFVKGASWGTAGLLLGPVAAIGQDDLVRPESPVIPQTAWGRVWIRWTEPALPAKTLSTYGLAIPWDVSPELLESARKQGYRVFASVTPAQPTANSNHAAGISGIILEAGDADPAKTEKAVRDLRLAYPDLTVLAPDSNAKQPKMMGSTVITERGILQVSSPTEQPWIDSNLALIRFNRAVYPTQTPLIDFQWEHSDALQQQLGPSPESYLLAVAEAGALHSDLILNLHPTLEKSLASGSDQAWAIWGRIAKYIEFYLRQDERPVAFQANVGVLTDNYDASYETMNLMARHNIPFRVLLSTQVTAHRLQGLDLIVVFAEIDDAARQQVAAFVNDGGLAILVSVRNPFTGQSTGPRRVSGDSVIYPMGKGEIIELATGVADPGAFSKDVRRLLGNEKLPISLWNASTTIAISYTLPRTSTVTVELLNYSADPMPVQVRIQGIYSVVRYETPERGAEMLTPTHQDGCTQFDVPWLRIGGRVHFGTIADPQKKIS
jgi:hypothetical protein